MLLSCQTTTRKRTSRKEYFYGRLCWFWKHLGMDIRLLLHETKKCPEGFVVKFFFQFVGRDNVIWLFGKIRNRITAMWAQTLPSFRKRYTFSSKNLFTGLWHNSSSSVQYQNMQWDLTNWSPVSTTQLNECSRCFLNLPWNRFFPAVVFLVLFIALRCAES